MSDPSNTHWDKVYESKAADAVSWYRPHLERSIELIERVAPDRSTSIIDVGGGEATLVDDLLGKGYRNISVLDISAAAIAFSRKRVGALAQHVKWIVSDVTTADLPSATFDVWHDRAVFHFLTTHEARAAYVRKVASAMKLGAHVIVATFGPEGPTKCSGLDVVRYDADSLHTEFGSHFQLLEDATEIHQTPFGSTQQFVYCLCKVQ
jgi:SAM-dependent methyltransferase